MKTSFQGKLVASYAVDWIITAALWGVFYAVGKLDGFKRQFSISDTSLQHSHSPDSTVPSWALYVIGLVAPAVVITITNLLKGFDIWDIHVGFLGTALSFALAASITNILKVTVGRPRPDIIARCQPSQEAVDGLTGLASSSICSTIDNDGWRSFPSGHSSMTMAGCAFLAFYLAGKMNIVDQRGHTYKGFIVLVPLLGSSLVGLSRLSDYRHHPLDVLIGLLLGLVTGYFAYTLYYPSPFSDDPEKPYPQKRLMIPLGLGSYDDEDHLMRTNSS